MQAQPTREGPRVNDQIRVPNVMLIDDEGENRGVMETAEAI